MTGQSGRGRQFAVRWGEVIFAIFPTLEFGRKAYAALQEESVSLGRAPGAFRVAPLVYVTVAESQSAAEDQFAAIAALAKPIDTLALLSEALNFDFASKPLDAPFSDDEMASNPVAGTTTIACSAEAIDFDREVKAQFEAR